MKIFGFLANAVLAIGRETTLDASKARSFIAWKMISIEAGSEEGQQTASEMGPLARITSAPRLLSFGTISILSLGFRSRLVVFVLTRSPGGRLLLGRRSICLIVCHSSRVFFHGGLGGVRGIFSVGGHLKCLQATQKPDRLAAHGGATLTLSCTANPALGICQLNHASFWRWYSMRWGRVGVLGLARGGSCCVRSHPAVWTIHHPSSWYQVKTGRWDWVGPARRGCDHRGRR